MDAFAGVGVHCRKFGIASFHTLAGASSNAFQQIRAAG
jgi:hypothetical protein